jgi:hypothetical protein
VNEGSKTRVQHQEFLSRLTLEYPRTASHHDIKQYILPTLIAPRVVNLPTSWLRSAEKIVSLFYNGVRESAFTRNEISRLSPQIKDSHTPSVLMSYDFHVDYSKTSSGQLKLIEINTNASMSLLLDVLNCQLHLGRCLKEDFLDDFETALNGTLLDKRCIITDESPQSQKLYIEFLMYKELFESRGAVCRIVDRTDLVFENSELRLRSEPDFGSIDLVYNRLTDFYFEAPESLPLRLASEHSNITVTPHPYDYRALADKTRMAEWSQPGNFEKHGLGPEDAETLRACLIRTRDIQNLDPLELWQERKSLIFKPKSSHAGKGVYRGASISRGAFQRFLESGGLAQDFIPAPTLRLDETEFKYDIRFFAFRDKVHAACVRLYQGQMTNATTPGGGVAAIAWKEESE